MSPGSCVIDRRTASSPSSSQAGRSPQIVCVLRLTSPAAAPVGGGFAPPGGPARAAAENRPDMLEFLLD